MGILQGKRAIVTGGGTGIGRGIALQLAKEGAWVCISYKRSSQGAEEALAEIKTLGGKAFALQVDLINVDEGIRFIETAAKTMGGVDILVNNAGLTITKPIYEVTQSDWDSIHTIDLKSSFFCSQTAARYMRNQGAGRIVFIGSVHSRASISLFGPYAAAKGGIEALTRQMAIELAPDHITVNSVAPGLIEVESYHQDFPWYKREDFARQIPIGRVGFPQDIASVVSFIVSDQSGFMTGQSIYVDGGQLSLLAINRPDI